MTIDIATNYGIQSHQEVVLQAVIKGQLKEPAMYQVVMLNDDFTPMDFVVEVLELFFFMDNAKATKTMYEVHQSGQAICGVYSKDVAGTKVEQVMEYARRHEYPLLCDLEVT